MLFWRCTRRRKNIPRDNCQDVTCLHVQGCEKTCYKYVWRHQSKWLLSFFAHTKSRHVWYATSSILHHYMSAHRRPQASSWLSTYDVRDPYWDEEVRATYLIRLRGACFDCNILVHTSSRWMHLPSFLPWSLIKNRACNPLASPEPFLHHAYYLRQPCFQVRLLPTLPLHNCVDLEYSSLRHLWWVFACGTFPYYGDISTALIHSMQTQRLCQQASNMYVQTTMYCGVFWDVSQHWDWLSACGRWCDSAGAIPQESDLSRCCTR